MAVRAADNRFFGVAHIALNDEPREMDAENMAGPFESQRHGADSTSSIDDTKGFCKSETHGIPKHCSAVPT